MLISEFFKIQNCSHRSSSVLLVVFLLFSVSCSRVNDGLIRGKMAIESVMDRVESTMDDDATLADSLIKLIDPLSIRGKEERARYALLYTAAEYKNYQVFTSDSLIMTAVRYYSISHNLDYKFQAYYYLGCVYLELGKQTEAAAAFANAEQLSNYIENEYWKGLLFFRLGMIFFDTYDYHRSEDYYNKAVCSFEKAGKEKHRLYALLNVGNSKYSNEDYKEADSILQTVEKQSIIIGDSVLYNECLINRLSCLIYMKEPNRATSILDNIHIDDESPNYIGYLQTLALYYNSVKDYSKSETFLNKVLSLDLSKSDSILFYYIKYLLANNEGHTVKALDYFRKYTMFQDESLIETLSQPILGAQKEQYRIMAENELLKYRHARLTLILCVVIFMLILVIVLVTYHYKKKRMKEQLFDSLSVVEELSGKIEDLKNQVRIQFHERHDLSNRLYSIYFDSESQEKITKQQLNVTINSLIKDYTAPDSVKKLDKLLNEAYDGIMDSLTDPKIGLTDKEVELFRFSFAGLSSKSISVIIKESPQNIYQIKSRLLKKVKRNSEELWIKLSYIW